MMKRETMKTMILAAAAAALSRGQPGIRVNPRAGRIASLEMVPEAKPLPHRKCSQAWRVPD
jgi:hypothetical protein